MSIVAEYYKLGIGLRLKPGELQAIRKSCGQDIDQAFTDVLLAWLRQRYDVVKYGPPTWRMLVKAVDSPAGGNNHALALTISHNHSINGKGCKAYVCAIIVILCCFKTPALLIFCAIQYIVTNICCKDCNSFKYM